MPLTISSHAPDAPGHPLWSADEPPLVTGTGETCRLVNDGPLRLVVAGHCYAHDHELRRALTAVRDHDWAALTVWPGSYWVVADDGETTAVLTDLAATRPVYYASGSRTAWSTSASSLAHRLDAGVDYSSLAARLICPTVPEICGQSTTFLGIQRLPGGHALTISRNGGRRIVAYERRRTLPFDQAASELRESLLEAVRRRTDSTPHVTADFSGGLDSTSIALLALRSGSKLVAVNHHPEGVSDNDDFVYAQRAAADQPGLTLRTVGDNTGLFFDDLDSAPSTDQPFPDAARWRMRFAYQRHCAEEGSELHLTGSGGDTLLTASPYYLADLTGAGLRHFLEHCRMRARLRHFPVHTVATTAALTSRTSNATALHQLARDLAAGIPVPPPHRAAKESLGWMRLSGARSWLTPDARHHLSRKFEEAARESAVPRSETSRHRHLAELHEFGSWEAELRTQAQGMGIPHHAPLLDTTVVRAALAVPVAEHASVTAQKPLLGTALSGLVPEWLLQRTTKGAYFGNAYTGLRRNADAVRELLLDSRLAAEGWINADTVLAEVDRLTAGAAGKWAALEAVVTTELWLRQHADSGGAHA
ncbi:albusnodin/ikarugamycin family macrolactam cyclase [Streptomyces sp. ODS28]|uniref:albusnodin/ikarugamycin family macrolactam cyclase n=1 Tax=Streptomyces sp. ODS28 TaxID=3136688 RepID=UPI0031E77158